MFENPRRGRQARNFTTNVSKILDLKSSSGQIFFRKLSLGAPEIPLAKLETVKETVFIQMESLHCRQNRCYHFRNQLTCIIKL